jgi:hypothetical protein
MGFTQWQLYHNKTQHKNTHITQNITPRTAQSYTNNKGHITHNEYNTKRVKLSLQQTVEAYRIVRC